MTPGTDAKWNKAANLASMRDIYPTSELNSLPGELNNVSGKDPYDLPPIPDGHYDSSLSSVKDLGDIKKGEDKSLLKKVATSGAILAVTAATIMSAISSAKPTISEMSLSKDDTSVNYSFKVTYSKVATLDLTLSSDKGSNLEKTYTLNWNSEGTSDGSNKYQVLKGSFTEISLGLTYTLTIKANAGYGTYQIYQNKI